MTISRPSSPGPDTAATLYGRQQERGALAALMARAQAGNGGFAVVHGEPGIGKSALLDDVARAAAGMRVLRVTCVEWESDLGYATLHHLLKPALELLHRLPEPQAAALRAVFGLADGPIPDRFLVGLATLSLLSELAEGNPLLCIVDDAHWAADASINVLEFVARRLDTEPIALVLAARAHEGRRLERAGAVDLPLAGLDCLSARQLLVEQVGTRLTPSQREVVLNATAGNPLAIRELPATVVGACVPPRPLPLVEELQQAFLRRVRCHSEPLQRLMLLIAADGNLRWDVLRRAASVLDAALESAVDGLCDLGDLVTVEGPTVVFRHPLIRSAVYHGATVADRRNAHRALAAVVDDEDELRAWHLGQAVEGRDEDVARELEHAARRAARSSSATAAALLARAMEVGEPGWGLVRRRLESAEAWWHGGDFDRAKTMLEGLEPDSSLEPLRVRATLLRASLELHIGRPADALAMLRPVLPRALEAGSQQSIPLLMRFWEAGFAANAADAWAELSNVVEQQDLTGTGVWEILGRLLRGTCRTLRGKEAGLAPGDLDAAEHLTDPGPAAWAAGMIWELGDRKRGRHLSRIAMQHARRLGTPVPLSWALWRVVVDDLESGRFRSAEAFAEEGCRLTEETGQRNAHLAFRGAQVMLAALRGDDEADRTLAGHVKADAIAHGMVSIVVLVQRALGLLELAAGRPAQALLHFQPPAGGSYLSVTVVNVPDLVEAAVQSGHVDLAAEPLALFTRWAQAAETPELNALAARCRALLAPPEHAAAEFRRSLALYEHTDQPFETARTQLLFGRYLRRNRRKFEARAPLDAALETFQMLGATLWADRAREELRATGVRIRPRATPSTVQLTPQEARIAEAVADGYTNRDIAAQMFLSTRTIDYHLRKMYQKAGVNSRAELTRILLTQAGNNRGARRPPR
ncbi:helix-turn-helix transcriptional regulator [Nocardia carnea]|uniref:helix-turn-helix transcriptional regulator n=2 Tax=Nocardia carnea TaxID=37328 RepID=UPI002458D4E5|nr:LuxR family transcriptional regulator [Nocardia carnea]